MQIGNQLYLWLTTETPRSTKHTMVLNAWRWDTTFTRHRASLRTLPMALHCLASLVGNPVYFQQATLQSLKEGLPFRRGAFS